MKFVALLPCSSSSSSELTQVNHNKKHKQIWRFLLNILFKKKNQKAYLQNFKPSVSVFLYL